MKVLRSDSRLGTCVAIVQCEVSVETSSSTGASSGPAAAVVVVSSHSIGSGLRVIARASTSSGDRRTLGKCPQLRPHDAAVDTAGKWALGKTAIGAGHQAVAADTVGKSHEPLGHELRV